jgi:alpha-D-xyloside xylohydrolase
LLRTFAPTELPQNISSADLERLAADGDRPTVEGRLQIDFLADGALRLRYAEGDRVPENQTPMLAVTPAPDPSVIVSAGGDTVSFRAATYSGVIRLQPFALELRGADGQPVTTVSAPQASRFNSWDAYPTGLVRALDRRQCVATQTFTLSAGQAVYGFGEKFIGLNKAGQVIDLDAADALGVTSPRSYKNIPFFATTQGYGAFFNHSSRLTFWPASLDAARVQAAVDDDFLDCFVFTGSVADILTRYTALTGRPSVPPAWSFGFWQSKISYSSADEVIALARELRRQRIPCDVIHLDTFWFERNWFCNLEFSPTRFPDPAAFFAELRRLHFKISLWQLPYLPEGSALFDELAAVNGFVRDADGGIYDIGICFTKGFSGKVGVIDYTNPAAVTIHQRWLKKLFALGAAVIKTDFGEDAPADGVYHDGTPGRQMHNLYPLLYNRAVSNVSGGLVWSRSAWAGSQRYPVHWGGDSSPDWDNMLPQLAGGLSLGLSGFTFWSQDIGGFFGETNDRLLIRWLQCGVFLSHARIHGVGDRELYKFAPETLQICREFLRLRYRLLPYILAEAKHAADRGQPLARPLVLDFQDDPTTWNIQDEFLFGRDLLVAPIFSAADHRRVYLPPGGWTDWWTGETVSGSRWLDVASPLDRIPLYIRAGANIPLGADREFIDEEN